MSIVMIDSCDLYDGGGIAKKGWALSTVPPTHSLTGGYYGGGHLVFDTGQHVAIGGGTTEYTKVSMWFRSPTLAADTRMITIMDDPAALALMPSTANQHAALSLKTDGRFEITGENNDYVGATDPGLVTANKLHHLEMIQYIANGGYIEFYLDGTYIGQYSGDMSDTNYIGSAIYIGSSSGILHVDDIIIEKTESGSKPPWQGVTAIKTQFADADTAQADFTGSYLDIDDALGGSDDGTTQLTSSTLNHESRFGFQALSAGDDNILMVNHVVEHAKSDAGNRAITPFVLSGATRADSTEQTPAETFTMTSQILLTDPNTAAAWTRAGVDALEAGFKLTT